jgi:hypothetical protein
MSEESAPWGGYNRVNSRTGPVNQNDIPPAPNCKRMRTRPLTVGLRYHRPELGVPNTYGQRISVTIAITHLRRNVWGRAPFHLYRPLEYEEMYVEAVRKDAAPSRIGLIQDDTNVECPQCWAAYHLYHDGMDVKLLRGYFLRASWQVSGEHPNHSPVIVLESSSVAAQDRAS